MGNPPIIPADFNSDGIMDIAILGPTSGTQGVSILLGRADGTFAPAVNYPVAASGITVGDFNGDGKLDIIAISKTDYPIADFLAGNGDGTFQSAASLDLGISNAEYSFVASADFNGDGKLDIVLLTPNYGTGATLAIEIGNGNGSFQAPVTYSVPTAPYVAIGDFNGDGKPDIAVSGPYDMSSPAGVIVVLINNGNGTFKAPVQYAVNSGVMSLTLADMNNDGKLDLMVYTSAGTTTGISVLPGIGDGTYASPVTTTSNLLYSYSGWLAVADFNGDGKLDVAAPSNYDYTFVLLLGKGDGTFQTPPPMYSEGLGSVLLPLDINRDGKPDVVAWGRGNYPFYSSLTVMINKGNGVFPQATTYPITKSAVGFVQGDLNGDGHQDIVVAIDTLDSGGYANGGLFSTFLGNGDGTFQPPVDTSNTSSCFRPIAIGDFNKDGKLDLVVDQQSLSYPWTEYLATWLGNGDGTFHSAASQPLASSLNAIAVGDFNHDGKLDLAAAANGGMYIFLGNGNGSFANPVTYGNGFFKVFAADFNSDGNLDLVTSNSQGTFILPGNPNGTFGAPTLVPFGSLMGVGDFNGDGKPDLLLAGSGNIAVALRNGNGTFQQATPFQLSQYFGFGSPVTGDFDGDGRLDVAFLSDTGLITIVFGKGDGTFGGQTEIASNMIDHILAADFNGDGVLDLAATDISNRTLNVFLNPPVAAFDPSPLTFPTLLVGIPSSPQTVSMMNRGPVPIDISNISTAGDFSQVDGCGSHLAPGATCDVDVTFAPSQVGTRTGTLLFTDTVPGSPQTVVLKGTGGSTKPLAGVSPGTLAFGNVPAGTTSAAQPVTLSSTGGSTLTISSIGVSAPFVQTNNCGSGLGPGDNCTIHVTFKPTSAGSASGNLTITDNSNAVAGSMQSVSLSGTGLAPIAVTLSPASASLAANGTQLFTATLTGTTNTALNWSVNGVLNGNATQGTLTGTGLTRTYTAPANNLPSPNPAVIKVASVADPAKFKTASVTVTSSVTLTLTPTTSTRPLGTTQLFTATITGTSNSAVNWYVNGVLNGNATQGTLTGTGLTRTYTAPSVNVPNPNPAVIKVASAAAPTQFKTATVTVTTPVAVTLSPTTVSKTLGGTQLFTAAVTGTTNSALNWYVNGVLNGNAAQGTLTGTGLTRTYTAPAGNPPNPNPVIIKVASAADPSKFKTASVTVTSTVAVTLSPSTASEPLGGTQLFSATITGTSNTSLNWYVNGVINGNSVQGTLTGTGLTRTYTAPTVNVPSPNPVVIKVASVADATKFKTASVTVTDNIALTLIPASSTRTRGAILRLTAAISNTSNTAVNWYVNGILNGNSTQGTLTGTGLVRTYTAPSANAPSPNPAVIKVASVADPAKFATATVTVSGP